MLIYLGGCGRSELDSCSRLPCLYIEIEHNEKLAYIVLHQNDFGESNQSILLWLKDNIEKEKSI
jgi:hypothetical protein